MLTFQNVHFPASNKATESERQRRHVAPSPSLAGDRGADLRPARQGSQGQGQAQSQHQQTSLEVIEKIYF